MSLPSEGNQPDTPDSERPQFLFWGDVHFLISAVHHLHKALERLAVDPQRHGSVLADAEQQRHLIEHWWKEADCEGAWKGLIERHGETASPWKSLDDGLDLKIGSDNISVQQLEAALREILDALVKMERESEEKSEPFSANRKVFGA